MLPFENNTFLLNINFSLDGNLLFANKNNMSAKIFSLIALLVLFFVSCTKESEESPDSLSFSETLGNTFNGKYIVVLNPDPAFNGLDARGKKERIHMKAQGLQKKYGITDEVEGVYETVLQGFVLKMDAGEVSRLKSDSLVKYVEADQYVTLLGKRSSKPASGTTTATAPAGQTIPWGVARTGGGTTYSSTGVAWVLDSGVDLTHPDLHVDAARGISYVTGVSSPNDDNGHGTHVAGIIAAINNSIGVAGVAAGATVIPVKVLDSTGSGTFSGVLSGINYVAANGKTGDVANMSLGGGISPTIDDAVVKASAVVKFAIAAGNETDDANNHSPARANGVNVYTVSAMSSGDTWASFSNYSNGPVDFCAPGVSVYSTYKNGSYVSMSGTSMAAPHVAGLLLWGNIATSGFVSNDPDGQADPIAHK